MAKCAEVVPQLTCGGRLTVDFLQCVVMPGHVFSLPWTDDVVVFEDFSSTVFVAADAVPSTELAIVKKPPPQGALPDLSTTAATAHKFVVVAGKGKMLSRAFAFVTPQLCQ